MSYESGADINQIKLNAYKEFRQGMQLSFDLRTLNTDGSINIKPQICTIGRVHGGGFFGQVIEPETGDFILKTPTPDPFHHLLRTVNWDYILFPAQINETDAQIEHLNARLIHDVLLPISKGAYYSPDSRGYTLLSTGFSQVLEKMNGRGPRYDLDYNEFEVFRNAQRDLSGIAYRLGLEQVGQIHPDNPYAMANLWWDEQNRRWIWLDVNPAIPHKGRIWPFFYFKFHEEIREHFNSRLPTFNRIHTDHFRSEIETNRSRFSDDLYHEIMLRLDLYDQLWEEKKGQKGQEWRSRGVALNALTHILIDAIPGLKNIAIAALVDPFRVVFDPEFRIHNVLKGLEEARLQNIISESEYGTAISELLEDNLSQVERRRRDIIIKALPIYYAVTGQLLNMFEAAAYTSAVIGDDKLRNFLAGVFIGWVFPSFFRLASTKAIGFITKTDLNIASVISIAPKGLYLYSIPAQYAAEPTRGSNSIWHYYIRKGVADLSKIFGGGWGSELEGQLMNLIGNRIEVWTKPKKTKRS